MAMIVGDRWPYTICDVFTARPLAGNQLAVFTDAREIPDALLQPLAREINFSETVYVYPPVAGGTARIRIFTTAVELPFAGHPVLGTAFVLATSDAAPEITLETGVGLVPVAMTREQGRPSFGWMRQPVPTIRPCAAPEPLLAALGGVSSRLPIERYDNGPSHLFVTLTDPAAVTALAPDMGALARVARETDGGIVGVSCFAGAGTRWKTRMFAPVEGFEDPATGSAAGPLACHLVRHGEIPSGTEIEISQGVEIGRPSTLHARVSGTADEIARVEVGGTAVIVGEGAFDAALLMMH